MAETEASEVAHVQLTGRDLYKSLDGTTAGNGLAIADYVSRFFSRSKARYV